MVEGTQSQTGGENPEREIHSITGQKSGDPKARRRSEEAWHTHGDFILHTSQRCFGMLPPAIRKAAGFRVKKTYV